MSTKRQSGLMPRRPTSIRWSFGTCIMSAASTTAGSSTASIARSRTRDLQPRLRILNSKRSKPGKKRRSSPRSRLAAIPWATPAAASNVLEDADGAGAGMKEMKADGITEATQRAAWRDLREFLDIAKQRGELVVVKGADPHLEMGALYELSLRKTYPPVLLFEEIKGYPRQYRVATNV